MNRTVELTPIEEVKYEDVLLEEMTLILVDLALWWVPDTLLMESVRENTWDLNSKI